MTAPHTLSGTSSSPPEKTDTEPQSESKGDRGDWAFAQKIFGRLYCFV